MDQKSEILVELLNLMINDLDGIMDQVKHIREMADAGIYEDFRRIREKIVTLKNQKL